MLASDERLGPESVLKLAIEKLKEIHPYEEPAYEVYKLENF
jgi:hypothetical protein